MSVRHLFVFGLGYTGLALARSLLAEGWRVSGTVRPSGADAANEAAAKGVTTIPFDRDHPLSPDALAGVTHILITIPPGERGPFPLQGEENAIADLNTLEWAGYLSSTAVYGDTGGEWVSETAWLRPVSDRARRRMEEERRWFDLCRRRFVPVHVFRLSAIYGPGRSAIDDLRAGRARRIDKPGQVFSRIHVDDIVTVLRASMAHPNPGGVYNLADDLPCPAHEVVSYAAERLGLPLPPLTAFDDADLSPMAASFYTECRRIKNDRIKRQLGVKLAYPDYRTGLDAQIAHERDAVTPG